MNKLEKAKEIIIENFSDGCCSIFNTQNNAGDWMTSIYNDNGLAIDICYQYAYFEVFGLSDDEFDELEKFYNILRAFISCFQIECSNK